MYCGGHGNSGSRWRSTERFGLGAPGVKRVSACPGRSTWSELLPAPRQTQCTLHARSCILPSPLRAPLTLANALCRGSQPSLKRGQGKGERFWTLDKPPTTLGYQCPSWDGKVTLCHRRLLQELIPSVTGVPNGISH